MKNILLITFMLTVISNATGQNAIEKQIRELYFEFEFPTTKYDVRKIMHSNEFISNVNESSYNGMELIQGSFTKNFKLSYYGSAYQKILNVWFKEGTDDLYAILLELQYSAVNVGDANKQFAEVENLFSKISYKKERTPISFKEEKIGEQVYLYSTSYKFINSEAFLVAKIHFIDTDNCYFVSFAYYPSHL